jgi:hypothetical protein
MAENGEVRVSGADFHWYVEPRTKEYPGFSAEHIDVLRITSSDRSFDIALWLRFVEFHGGSRIAVASPMVVLSEGFPTPGAVVQKGARLRVRPKVTVFREAVVTDDGVRRIVEWCLSRNFRAVRCSTSGLPQVTGQDDYSIGVTASRMLEHFR